MAPQQEPMSQSGAVEKVERPATAYEKPIDILRDRGLSDDQKKDALNTWEQDARQLLTASNEGMAALEKDWNRKIIIGSARSSERKLPWVRPPNINPLVNPPSRRR